jgi:tetratricopeptide (TPR) repeat protein
MAQEVDSFWADIKKYEDILLNDPNSYCFAQLSELYRKIGLLDDAIFVAKRGIEAHPDYVGGHLALGRAYFDKGQKANSRDVLELVVRMTPENYTAQKLLSRLYLEQNDIDLTKKTLQAVLELNPDDVESRLSLEALFRSGETTAAAELVHEEEEELEEAEIVEDDLLSLDEWIEDIPTVTAAEDPVPDEEPFRDPLTTATLAEIYLAQGFHDQALKIYRELADEAPGNEELRRRIAEIELLKADTGTAPASADSAVVDVVTPLELQFTGSCPESDADRAVAALEGWLQGIERRRACR